jgi:hypothetical protein
LDELARQPLPVGDAAAVHALLAHGRLLHDLLPAANGVLKALDAVPQTRDQAALRAMILTQQSASRATARQFWILLYVTSLLLVGLLAHVGLRLQAGCAGIAPACRVRARNRRHLDELHQRAGAGS